MLAPAEPSAFTKDNPFPARLVENRLLTGPGSEKETRHLVVDIGGSGLEYAAGDSLGIFPENDPAIVERLIALLGADGSELVTLPRSTETATLREALRTRVTVAGPGRKLLESLLALTSDPAERSRLESLLAPEAKETLEAFLAERECVDLLEEFPGARPSPQGFVEHLRKLMPRLYSIASSPKVHPAHVHLTVAIVRYRTNGRARAGVCTSFLADRVAPGETAVPVFVAKSHFGPPEDDASDMIMVGPGTGIAPFRAFLQERAARRATGRNWLFFGEQRRASDFLYEREFEAFREAGVLHRLDTAFSRDQAAKVYVQDRMRENAAELWRWLDSGASFFVCGDAKRMARDVDQALREILATQGGMDAPATDAFIKQLKKDRRYQRDVY